MDVRRSDKRDVHSLGHLNHVLHRQRLLGNVVVLDFKIIAVAENIPIPVGDFFRLLNCSAGWRNEQLVNLAAQTAGQNNNPLVVLLEQFLVDSRFVVISFQKRQRRQFDKVVKPGHVHRQHGQVEV